MFWGTTVLSWHGDAGALARAVERVVWMAPDQRRALGLALREGVEKRHGVERLTAMLARLLEEVTYER